MNCCIACIFTFGTIPSINIKQFIYINLHVCTVYTRVGPLLAFLKHILHISYFEDFILLILMVCFFLHITYRNLKNFHFIIFSAPSKLEKLRYKYYNAIVIYMQNQPYHEIQDIDLSDKQIKKANLE